MKDRCFISLFILLFLLSACSYGGTTTSTLINSQTTTNESPIVSPTETIGKPLATNIQITSSPIPKTTPALPIVPSPTAVPSIWYILQPGSPLPTNNYVHEVAGCSWLGVGGQIFGLDSTPVSGVDILVGGMLGSYQVGGLATSGMETSLGEGGYEITLSDHPVESTDTVWIQVVDRNNTPLSQKIYFDTYNDCDLNFILINFNRYVPVITQRNGLAVFLPAVLNRSNLQVVEPIK